MLVNGQAGDSVSILDRGLQYGDGVFETLRIAGGRPQFWSRHWQRLSRGWERLRLPQPDQAALESEVSGLCAQRPEGVLKIIITRGCGERGYRPPSSPRCTRIVYTTDLPGHLPHWRQAGVCVRLCQTRLSRNPALAGIKHLNRLEQVLARAEWEDEVQEGLMLDVQGHLVEGTMSNLFLVSRDGLQTPDLSHCGVSGITRARVMELARDMGLACREMTLVPDSIQEAEGAFLTNTLIGLCPIIRFGDLDMTVPPVIRRLQSALEQDAGQDRGDGDAST